MTTKCKFCSEEIRNGKYGWWSQRQGCGNRAMCSKNNLGPHDPAEPSTEGTQAAQPMKCMCAANCHFDCDDINCGCGYHDFNKQTPAPVAQHGDSFDTPFGKVIADARVPEGEIRIGTHDGPVLMENIGPAPVAQVDAGKIHIPQPHGQPRTTCGACLMSKHAECTGCECPCHDVGAVVLKPAVAQTELPPIPEHSKLPWRSVYPVGSKQRCAAVESAGDGVYVYLLVAHPDDTQGTINRWQADADFIVEACNNFASLTQRLQEQEAEVLQREQQISDLNQELEDHATDRVNQRRQLTALQASHDALLPYAKAHASTLRRACINDDNYSEAIANAEKLRGHTESEQK